MTFITTTHFKYLLFLLLQNDISLLPSTSLSSPLLASAFMPYSRLQVKTINRKNHQSNRKWSMYFDDISRSNKYTISWNDDSDDNIDNGIYFSDGRQGFRTNIDGTENKSMSKYYAEQKLDALQKSLYGYDPSEVSQFSIDKGKSVASIIYEPCRQSLCCVMIYTSCFVISPSFLLAD